MLVIGMCACGSNGTPANGEASTQGASNMENTQSTTDENAPAWQRYAEGGNNAVGTTELSGMGLKMIIKSPEQIGGALDQFGTAGWKMTKAAEILQDKYITKVYSASSLGGLIEESN